MKKFLLTFAVAMASLCASAGLPGIFDHLGVGVGVGTTGINVEAATPITRFVQMRAGVAIMPGISFSTSVDYDMDYTPVAGGQPGTYGGEIDVNGNLKRTQGYVLFNIYPFPVGSFYIAAGAYFGGDKLVKISGYSPELAEHGGDVLIGDYRLPTHNGRVEGGIKVKSFRPYLGIGWGRAVPGKLLNFGIDLGVQIHGKPSIYSEYGEINMSEITDDDTFQKIMDKVKVYPTLTFKLGFRAF